MEFYKTLVGPHELLPCAILVVMLWEDGLGWERMSRRFTWMLPGMESFSCWGRLNRLGLFTLEQRSLSEDLAEVYTIIPEVPFL